MVESEWVEPVEIVGDIIIVGEQHRKRASRKLVKQVWEKYDIESVCVEVGPNQGLRDDGGGAIGGVLEWASEQDIPRFYVDEPLRETVDAYGGKYTALREYRRLENKYSVRSDGKFSPEEYREVRQETFDKFGPEAFKTIFAKRERKMASRTVWVSKQTSAKVLLVVGAGHFYSIVNLIRGGVDPIQVKEKREWTGDRWLANDGPYTQMLKVLWFGITTQILPSLYNLLKNLKKTTLSRS